MNSFVYTSTAHNSKFVIANLLLRILKVKSGCVWGSQRPYRKVGLRPPNFATNKSRVVCKMVIENRKTMCRNCVSRKLKTSWINVCSLYLHTLFQWKAVYDAIRSCIKPFKSVITSNEQYVFTCTLKSGGCLKREDQTILD